MIEAIKIIQDQLIKPRMNELGITNYQISKETGISNSTLSRWFDGSQDIGLSRFLDILRVLKINPQYGFRDDKSSKYSVEKSGDTQYDWIAVDLKYYMTIQWKQGSFDDSQKVTVIDQSLFDPKDAATIINGITAWLVINHKEKL